MDGILNRDLSQGIASSQAAMIRGKMGVDNGNKFIQDTYNKVYGKNHCGYNKQ